MGLLIYSEANPSSAFSADGGFANPLSQAFDGVTGNVQQTRYYVRNDDATMTYSGISVQPVHLSDVNIIDGTDGFDWKLIAGDSQPLEEQWALVGSGNSISIPQIGTASVSDIATFEPFWLRVTVPKGAPVQSHAGIKLRLTGTSILVP
jgi:hypothetical protein